MKCTVSAFVKSNPIFGTTHRYFKSFYDAARYGGKDSKFKIGNVEFENGKDWKRQEQEKNPEYNQFRKAYWLIVGGSVVTGGLLGFAFALKEEQPADCAIGSFIAGSLGGVFAGAIHPVAIPVALPVLAVLYPLHKISDMSYRAKCARKEKEREAERLKNAQETRDILHKYTKFVDGQNSGSEKKIISYFDWCIQNGHNSHKWGYYDGNSRYSVRVGLVN